MHIRPAQIRFDDDGNAHCEAHGDIYFNPGRALAKARELFHAATDLAERLRTAAASPAPRIVVGELGFGLGLNFLATWSAAAEAGAHLHYVAVEGAPPPGNDLAHAHAGADLDPATTERAAALQAAWPGPVAGVHRVVLPGATLTLHQGQVDDALAAIAPTTRADAWFLDGFDPAKNPAMWSETALAAVFDRTAPGGAAGTFSSAGTVRRALAAAGFAVEKLPGGTLKRHITRASKPDSPKEAFKKVSGTFSTPSRACVLGAGWAGLHAADALARRGWRVTVCERDRPGAGASGNPVALVGPVPERAPSPRHDWYRSALTLARQQPDFEAVGAHRAPTDHKPGAWLRRAADNFGALDGRVAWRDDPPGLWYTGASGAGLRRFDRYATHVLAHPGITLVERDEPVDADLTVLATAAAVRDHPACAHWPLEAVRGQLSLVRGTPESQHLAHAINGPGYLTPGLCFDGTPRHAVGATHDRDDPDPAVRDADHQRNRDGARRSSATWTDAMDWTDVTGRTSWRCNARDRMPVVGAVSGANDLYALTALTSHGALSAPLAAELLVDLIEGTPLPCGAPAAKAVRAARFGEGSSPSPPSSQGGLEPGRP